MEFCKIDPWERPCRPGVAAGRFLLKKLPPPLTNLFWASTAKATTTRTARTTLAKAFMVKFLDLRVNVIFCLNTFC
jgi:hypothetical protein